jgi:predicted nucleic acid-binding protein
VLDTHVVLDLWLFADARVALLRSALQSGRLQALVTDATLAELADVLQRPFARARAATGEEVLAALASCSFRVDPLPAATPRAPRCTDADDQKFIDLAWGWPATWLLSRDRAVLKLARAARLRGVLIGTPERWAAAQGTG